MGLIEYRREPLTPRARLSRVRVISQLTDFQMQGLLHEKLYSLSANLKVADGFRVKEAKLVRPSPFDHPVLRIDLQQPENRARLNSRLTEPVINQLEPINELN